jgi:SAM-dependent methyltransferase
MVGYKGKIYFEDNYQNYERQSSSKKLHFYLGLLTKWVSQGSQVFEIGVGMGHFLKAAGTQYDFQGCDINKYGLESARKKVPQAKLYAGSYEMIPSDWEPKAIVAWDVLEHIEDLDRALSVIYARLADEGFFIGIVPVYDGPLGGLVRRLDHDPTHVWKLSRHQWHDQLEEHGFVVVETGGVIRRLIMKRWYLHLTHPKGILRKIGSAYYFVSQKSTAKNQGERL